MRISQEAIRFHFASTWNKGNARSQQPAEFDIDPAQGPVSLARFDRGVDASAERWQITASVAGVILKVLQESETVVMPGTPLVEIGDPRDLEIVADVLSSDKVEIQPGAEVSIERWGGLGVLAGQVRRVEPTAFTKISTPGVEEQRVNIVVDVVSPPAAGAYGKSTVRNW